MKLWFYYRLESKESGVLGVMQRAVACVLVSHESRAVHRAVDDDNCFTVARKPDPVRLCRVPTPQVSVYYHIIDLIIVYICTLLFLYLKL